MRLVGSAEMREIDRTAIEEFGIPSLTLMDRAGRAVADAAARARRRRRGGSWWCAAAGTTAATATSRPGSCAAPGATRASSRSSRAERLSPDARAVREQARARRRPHRRGGRARAASTPGVGDVVVDAIFGTGLARAPEGAFAGAIARIEAARVAGARVLAVDVPSGLSADTGRPLGPCVRADRTVTFGFQKRGLVLYPGAALAGEVTVADIGIPPEAARRVPARLRARSTEVEARLLVPPRAPDAHKGDAGRLLVVAGSAGKTGAAHLALTGALRGGAGLVTLAARAEVLPFALAGRPGGDEPRAARRGAARARRPPGAARARARGRRARRRARASRAARRRRELLRALLDRGRRSRRSSTRTGSTRSPRRPPALAGARRPAPPHAAPRRDGAALRRRRSTTVQADRIGDRRRRRRGRGARPWC